MKTIFAAALIAVGALGLWTVFPAQASWVLIPGDTTDRNLHGCGSSYAICHYRAAVRSGRQPRVQPCTRSTAWMDKCR